MKPKLSMIESRGSQPSILFKSLLHMIWSHFVYVFDLFLTHNILLIIRSLQVFKVPVKQSQSLCCGTRLSGWETLLLSLGLVGVNLVKYGYLDNIRTYFVLWEKEAMKKLMLALSQWFPTVPARVRTSRNKENSCTPSELVRHIKIISLVLLVWISK